jgi:hypothetical protein
MKRNFSFAVLLLVLLAGCARTPHYTVLSMGISASASTHPQTLRVVLKSPMSYHVPWPFTTAESWALYVTGYGDYTLPERKLIMRWGDTETPNVRSTRRCVFARNVGTCAFRATVAPFDDHFIFESYASSDGTGQPIDAVRFSAAMDRTRTAALAIPLAEVH